MGKSKISELGSASTLDGTELVPVVQGGVTVRSTATAIAALGGGGGGITTLAVADFTDPSAELNAISGSAVGDLRLCYEATAAGNIWTLYAWDDADSDGENVPYTVDGLTGRWQAVAGRYASQTDTHALGGSTHTAATLAELNALVSDATLIDTADSRLSDSRSPTAHALGGAGHTAATLAELNALVSDATLIDTGDSRLSDARTPSAHTVASHSDTTATGAELNELVGGGATTLHSHTGGGGVTTLSVTNIDDPSTELNAISGSAKGDLRLCYQTVAGRDEWTMYAWDDADSGIEKVPIRVDGLSGMWNAIAGKYVNAIKLPDDGVLGASANRAAIGFASDATGIGGLTRNYVNGDIYLEGTAGDSLILGIANVNVLEIKSTYVAGGLRSGTAAAPYWYLNSDFDTGIYRPGADQYAVATGGTKAGEWDASQNYIAAAHVYPDTDSANDLGLTATRWRELFVDDITCTAAVNVGGALNHDGSTVGFYGTTPIAQQTGVGTDAASIHAALVALGLITA